MSKYILIVEVDEELLDSAANFSGEEVSTESLIEQEMGWVTSSGISLVSVEKDTEYTAYEKE